MPRRRLLGALLTAGLVLALLPISALADTPPPLPGSMAATGDSITQAASSGGSLGADYPQNSWATGTSTSVNSQYLRLLSLNPAISGRNDNRSVSGAKMADLTSQMQQVVTLQPDYVTVLMGGNDLCTDTEAQMTPVADFRAQFAAAMGTLTSGSPDSWVFVASVPDAYRLWELFRGNWWARFIWSAGDICQSLLANPTSTQTADVERRARVRQRNIDYNTQLAEVCATFARCRFDGNAVFNTSFTSGDVSGDYFHPSVQGQAKLAAVTWAASYWAAPPNAAPVAAFSASCSALTCSFDGSASTDDGGIASWSWSFGDGSGGSGVTATHAYAAGGTYQVILTVTDGAGLTGSASQTVAVTASSAGTVHLASATGTSATRKGGWTASVTVSVADDAGAPVGGAQVSGSWSGGAGAGCTTGVSGTCTFSTNFAKKVASSTWTVSGIVHAALTYDPTANAVSSVSVTRP